jgi:hypothetical protein
MVDKLVKDASHLHYITMVWVKTEPDGRLGEVQGHSGHSNGRHRHLCSGRSREDRLQWHESPHRRGTLLCRYYTAKFFVIGDATRDGNIQRGMWDALSKTLHL